MYADSLSGLTLQWNKAIVNAVRCTCAFVALTTPNVSVEKSRKRSVFGSVVQNTPQCNDWKWKGEKKNLFFIPRTCPQRDVMRM